MYSQRTHFKSVLESVLRWLLLLIAGQFLATFGEAAAAPGCRVVTVVEDGISVGGRVERLADDTMQVYRLGPGTGTITLVLPLGEGQSGDIVQATDGETLASVRCRNGALEVAYPRPDGTSRSMPPVPDTVWETYEVRVNVTRADGHKRAFMLRSGELGEAPGPVLDMFQGMIPLQPGDYSVTTEVRAASAPATLVGEAALEFNGNHLFVRGRLPDGSSGRFVVDFGAGGSAVERSFLPGGAEITQMSGIEYSDQGERTVAATMQGVGGAVEGFLGRASLDGLAIGSAVIPDLRVSVIDDMPDLGSENVVGILGMDVLRSAGLVSLDYGPEDGLMVLGGLPLEGAVEIPFSTAAKHLFLKARAGGEDVTLLFDTGARISFLSTSLVELLGLDPIEGESREIRGLDGQPLEVIPVKVPEIVIGEHAVGAMRFHVGRQELPVLRGLGLQGAAGILGNDFLQTYQTVQVDFDRQVIRLAR